MRKTFKSMIVAAMKHLSGIFVIPAFLFLPVSCKPNIPVSSETGKVPEISPDYVGITIPRNIAPMNFIIKEEGDRYMVVVTTSDKTVVKVKSNDNLISFKKRDWKKIMERSEGRSCTFEVYAKNNGSWHRFKSFVNNVAEEPIDSYITYRLIEPGFEMWGNMGIYQRCLENFNESPVMINALSEHNCINCHSFASNDSRTMLFHMRGKQPGTIVYRDGELSKVNTKTDSTISAGVYPSWHPGGKYVAFSVNKITQVFHAVSDKRVEVVDTLSDIILYDSEKNAVSTCASLSTILRYETFPSWSPDGLSLYFCSAEAEPLNKYDQIRYDLLRIGFNPETGRFGTVDTIVSSSETGRSVSFPRISPDGKFLLFCMSEYGNFSIWHKESDLYLMNLETREITRPEINSDQSESYHSWSSNGRWVVFSSRRIDGLFTRPYFAYLDSNGVMQKPFILPQKDPEFYNTFLKSYNIPELIKTKIDLNPGDISGLAGSEPSKALFISN